MKRFRLIPNARRWWRMASVQMMAAAGALQVLVETQPALVTSVVPQEWVPRITLGLVLAGIFLRLVQQPAVSGPDSKDAPK